MNCASRCHHLILLVLFALLVATLAGACKGKGADEWKCPLMGLRGGAISEITCDFSWECREKTVAVSCLHNAYERGEDFGTTKQIDPTGEYNCICTEWDEDSNQELEYETGFTIADVCSQREGEIRDSRQRARLAARANSVCGWKLPTSY